MGHSFFGIIKKKKIKIFKRTIYALKLYYPLEETKV